MFDADRLKMEGRKGRTFEATKKRGKRFAAMMAALFAMASANTAHALTIHWSVDTDYSALADSDTTYYAALFVLTAGAPFTFKQNPDGSFSVNSTTTPLIAATPLSDAVFDEGVEYPAPPSRNPWGTWPEDTPVWDFQTEPDPGNVYGTTHLPVNPDLFPGDGKGNNVIINAALQRNISTGADPTFFMVIFTGEGEDMKFWILDDDYVNYILDRNNAVDSELYIGFTFVLPIPEPATGVLVMAGCAVLGLRRRRHV